MSENSTTKPAAKSAIAGAVTVRLWTHKMRAWDGEVRRVPIGDMTPVGLDSQVKVLVAGRRIGDRLVKKGAKFCWLPRNHLKKGKIPIDFSVEDKLAIVRRASELCEPIRAELEREAKELAELEKGTV